MTLPHLSSAALGLAAAIGLVVVVARTGGSPYPRSGHGAPPVPGRSAGGAGPPGVSRAWGLAWPGRRGCTGRPGARWAGRGELAPLVTSGDEPGRLVLGTLARPGGGPGRTVLAAEPAQSVAVIGPTQSGKTTALAVPAILGWDGPVLAASVKTDLVRETLAWRRSRGSVWCFDPGRATGLPASRWSPLPATRTWVGARRVAANLTEVAQGSGTTADGEFWYATAAKLLAPLLFAAASAGLDMDDVVRWVDTQEVAEVADILAASGEPAALQAARATWQRDDRQRSSVYTTAETVLEPFAEPYAGAAEAADGVPAFHGWPPGDGGTDTPPYGSPAVGGTPAAARPPRTAPGPGDGLPGAAHPGHPGAGSGDVDPAGLLLGSNTLYLCAPAHDQRRLRGLFTAVVKEVLEAAFARSARLGDPLSPPLLVVLDEAANIAPLAELDGLAATCAGHGVQLVTVWQDLAQVSARYGERAATVVNNHRAKIFLSGTADPRTLDHASHLVGEEELLVPSVTRDPTGARTVTTAPVRRPLLPPEALRRLQPGTGVLVYGSLPPVRLALRSWFDDPVLAARVRSPRVPAGTAPRPPAGTAPRTPAGTAPRARAGRARG